MLSGCLPYYYILWFGEKGVAQTACGDVFFASPEHTFRLSKPWECIKIYTDVG